MTMTSKLLGGGGSFILKAVELVMLSPTVAIFHTKMQCSLCKNYDHIMSGTKKGNFLLQKYHKRVLKLKSS